MTLTLKKFEKDLTKNGFEFKAVKETKNETLYEISKDDYKDYFYATNVLDNKAANYKLFMFAYKMQQDYHAKTGKYLESHLY